MERNSKNREELLQEIEELRRRLGEAEDSLVCWRRHKVEVPAGQGKKEKPLKKSDQERASISENDYRTLSENLPGIVYRVFIRENYRMQFFNKMLQPMTGYTDEELSAGEVCSIEPFILSEDRAAVVTTVKRAILDNQPFEVEYRLTRRGGDIRYFFERGRPLYGEDGSPLYIDGVIFDITERRQMEEGLKKSRDELEKRVQERTAELTKASEELAEQSRILEGFFTSTITPLVFLDRNFNFIRANEAYAKACQRSIPEFPGHNLFEFYPSDAKKIFEQVVKTKLPYQAAAQPFSFPDHPEWGVTYWDWALTPLLDDRGEVEFLVFSLKDVTERKRAEEAVNAERQRFNDVLEILPAYLVLLTPDYHVPFANRFFRERFGESRGRRCFEYLFGRSEPCEICETYIVLKTKAPHYWEWTGPDGRDYDVFDFLFTDTDGSTLILEMGIDITERKRAKETVRQAAVYNRSLIEASPDPLVTIGPDGRITDVNAATELATGFSRNDLIGRDFCDYFTEPDKARTGYQRVFLEGSVRDYPLEIRHASGRVTDVLYNATVYRNEAGKVQGVFAAARDITIRKKREAALRESEMQLRYLSSQLLTAQENERRRIARELHDGLGQSLTAIKFKVESFLQEIRQSRLKVKAKPLEAIIPMIQEGVREIRRIQQDLRPPMLDDLGILATLSWLCREFEATYSAIHIEKQIEIQEPEVPDSLKLVIYRISQEALNNISKHSHADLVHVSFRKTEKAIELSVQDNGQGFDYQETLSAERHGRGLGLTSMKERAEHTKGSFSIESTKGKGTVMRASWPI